MGPAVFQTEAQEVENSRPELLGSGETCRPSCLRRLQTEKGCRRVVSPWVPDAVMPAAARETKPPGAAAVTRG
jgi:hypothetical protein